MAIAAAKAVLIVMYFMHVKYSHRLTTVICAGFAPLAGDHDRADLDRLHNTVALQGVAQHSRQVSLTHHPIVVLRRNGYDEGRDPPAFDVRTLPFGSGSLSHA